MEGNVLKLVLPLAAMFAVCFAAPLFVLIAMCLRPMQGCTA
jgi:hypothetical protein